MVHEALGGCASRWETVWIDRKADDFKPLWVVDFPLLEWDEETKRFYAKHHPFTSPLDEISLALHRSRRGARQRLRPGDQRHGDRGRLDPHSSAGASAEDVQVLGITDEEARNSSVS